MIVLTMPIPHCIIIRTVMLRRKNVAACRKASFKWLKVMRFWQKALRNQNY